MTREEREGVINFFKEVVKRECSNCAYYVNGANDEACDGCFTDGHEHPNFKPKAQPCDAPKEKIGHWEVMSSEIFKCSECKQFSDKVTDFCPNCGIRMVSK